MIYFLIYVFIGIVVLLINWPKEEEVKTAPFMLILFVNILMIFTWPLTVYTVYLRKD